MNTTSQSKNLSNVLASLSPEQRAEIEKRAGELAKNKDFRQAAEILEKSQSLDNAKFIGALGWLPAVSVAIAVIAVIVV
jgi:hypothetical protein